MKFRYIVWIVLVTLIGLGTAQFLASADTTLWGSFDASSGTEDASIWGATTRWEAQSFTTTDGVVPESAKLYLKRIGSGAGTLSADIQDDSSGSPSGSVVSGCGSSTIDSSTVVDTSYSLITFTYTSSTCQLLTTTKYWIVAKPTSGDGASNYVSWGYLSGGGFADGEGKQYTSGSWSGSVGDFGFELYEYTVVGGGETSTATTTPASTRVYNESQTVYNGFILFFILFFGIIFYFRKGVNK